MIGRIQEIAPRRSVAAGAMRNPARAPIVNMQDDLVDMAMTFRWLGGPTEIEARWPRLMAGLRRVADGVQAQHPTRRRSLGLDVAIDWCHEGILGLPLSEDAWAEAEGLIGRIKAMVGPDQVKRAHILPRSNGPGCNHAGAD